MSVPKDNVVAVYRPSREALLTQWYVLAVSSILLVMLLRFRFEEIWVAIPVILLVGYIALALYGIARVSFERVTISPADVADQWLWGGWRVELDRIKTVETVTDYQMFFRPGRDYFAIETFDGQEFRIDRVFWPEDDLRSRLEQIARANRESRYGAITNRPPSVNATTTNIETSSSS